MLLAKITGQVVSTAKHTTLIGYKMLLMRGITPDGKLFGPELMALDSVGAGAGETVLVVREGRSAGQAVRHEQAPVDAAIVGIVERIDSA